MSVSAVYASNVPLRTILKTLAFLCASFVAIFSAAAGYGLLKVLLVAISTDADVGLAEFLTHSGLTIGFFALAGLGAYVAKKCSGSTARDCYSEEQMNRRTVLRLLGATGAVGTLPLIFPSRATGQPRARYTVQGPSDAPTVLAFDRMPSGTPVACRGVSGGRARLSSARCVAGVRRFFYGGSRVRRDSGGRGRRGCHALRVVWVLVGCSCRTAARGSNETIDSTGLWRLASLGRTVRGDTGGH